MADDDCLNEVLGNTAEAMWRTVRNDPSLAAFGEAFSEWYATQLVAESEFARCSPGDPLDVQICFRMVAATVFGRIPAADAPLVEAIRAAARSEKQKQPSSLLSRLSILFADLLSMKRTQPEAFAKTFPSELHVARYLLKMLRASGTTDTPRLWARDAEAKLPKLIGALKRINLLGKPGRGRPFTPPEMAGEFATALCGKVFGRPRDVVPKQVLKAAKKILGE